MQKGRGDSQMKSKQTKKQQQQKYKKARETKEQKRISPGKSI